MATTENGVTSWKHIGLHGHSVGTFACTDAGIQWKSALYGRDDSAGGTASTRSIPKAAISGAQWTVFGKSGHLRIQTNKEQNPNSKLHHEMRFDGFPADDLDTLKDIFQEKYGLELTKLNMSAAGTQYGLSNITGRKLVFRHCVLDEADEEGEVSILLIFDNSVMKVVCLISLGSFPSCPFIHRRNLKFEREMK
jgi:POB3-like N-terminal PH domain